MDSSKGLKPPCSLNKRFAPEPFRVACPCPYGLNLCNMWVYELTISTKVVIPAKAGIQSFQRSLDAPVLSTGQAPHVRHDGLSEFMDRH